MKQTATTRRAITLLTALLLSPLAALHDGQDVPGVPTIGKPHGKDFQSLGNIVAMASRD